jgi:AraC-like DNA-binding protein/quercetin dioxygenase-like cupin family protein
MSTPSKWPLSAEAIRVITPEFIQKALKDNPITRHGYLTAMGYYPRAKQHEMKRERHDDNLLIYCVDGKGELNTPEQPHKVSKGDLIVLPSGYAHEYKADKLKPWTIYWFHVAGSHALIMLNNLIKTAGSLVIPIGLKPLLIADFKRLLDHRNQGYPLSVFNFRSSMITQILQYLALEISNLGRLHSADFNLDNIHTLMLEHLDRQLSLETLAQSCGLSLPHFASKYKQLTGTSPIKHFIHLKIERACYLLDSSQEAIKHISTELGYDDPLYFTRQFTQVMGVSPSEYRALNRG